MGASMGATETLEREAAPPSPPSSRLTVAIEGLSAAPDAPARITRVLEGTPGVVRAYVNPDTEMAYVEYRQGEITPGKLFAAIEAQGFTTGDATVISPGAGGTLPPETAYGSPPLPQVVTGSEPATEVITEDHSCCGPSGVSAGIAAGGAGDASTSSRSGKAGPYALGETMWPFKVRLGLFLSAVVLVLGPALWLIRPMEGMAMGADYNVDMSMTGFTPPAFSIPAGKPVSIQFNNVDSPFHGITNGALHQFAIDELAIDVRLDGKQSTLIDLPALEPGTYEFYCNVCCGGKVNPNMRGTLTVKGTEAMLGLEGMEEVSQR
jgi:cytochrome c oxidase subunit II